MTDNKTLLEYYKNDCKTKGLFVGLNDSILKPYTTNGFIKSIEMWDRFSHESFDAFLKDFSKMYSTEYLKENCNKCYEKLKEKYPKKSKSITYDMLYDKLFYKLVVDCYIGHACENEIFNNFNEHFKKYNKKLKAVYDYKFDTKYGIDIVVVDEEGKINSLFQVKNKTFFMTSKYNEFKIRDQVNKEKLFWKENEEYSNVPIYYYVYDKDLFLDTGKFFIFNNSLRKDCGCKFLLSDFVDLENKTIINRGFFDNNTNGKFI